METVNGKIFAAKELSHWLKKVFLSNPTQSI
jgi:hypothetical protein